MDASSQRRGRLETGIALTAIALLIVACFLILRPFISAALWAVILCLTTWPLFSMLTVALGYRRTLAAAIATLALAALIVVPIAILVVRLSGNMSEIITASQRLLHEGPPPPPAWVSDLPLIGGRISANWTLLNESSSARIEEVAQWMPTAKKFLLGSGRAVSAGFLQIILSLLMMFFLFRDGEAFAHRLKAIIARLYGEEGDRVLEGARTTMNAVVYGVLGTAPLQGILAAIGYMIAGVPGATLLGFITFVVSMVPAGPMLVAAPAVFWLYRRSSTGWTIFMIAWALIVGSMDHFVRPLLISQGGAKIPLILVILGVFGGALSFGLIGLFLGPTILAVGFSLLDEWSSASAAKAAHADGERNA